VEVGDGRADWLSGCCVVPDSEIGFVVEMLAATVSEADSETDSDAD
jgi:hypothetical protein